MNTDLFKKYLPYLVIILSIGYIFFSQKNPCESAITYKLGSFDKRFGISQKEFLQTINDSATIWNTSINKEVLTYDPQGEITINLTYDERQRTTEINTTLKTDAVKINELASEVKRQYLALDVKYNQLENEYQSMITHFKAEEKEYSTQVHYWNTQGGAPKNVFGVLTEKRNVLEQERQELEKKRLELNALVEQINTFINKYNLLVHSANTKIDTINRSAGQEFEEGVYDPMEKAITIYEFSSEKKLRRVITHELGHALNLPHNNNPESIMYALNEANTLTLSKEDVSALQQRCEVVYPFINFYNNLTEKFVSFLP